MFTFFFFFPPTSCSYSYVSRTLNMLALVRVRTSTLQVAHSSSSGRISTILLGEESYNIKVYRHLPHCMYVYTGTAHETNQDKVLSILVHKKEIDTRTNTAVPDLIKLRPPKPAHKLYRGMAMCVRGTWAWPSLQRTQEWLLRWC